MPTNVFTPSPDYVFVDKREAARLIGFAPDTLRKFRDKGLLKEGIHWIRINSRSVRYNKELLLDWMVNCHDQQAHQRAIDAFLLSLPSNKKGVRRRSMDKVA